MRSTRASTPSGTWRRWLAELFRPERIAVAGKDAARPKRRQPRDGPTPGLAIRGPEDRPRRAPTDEIADEDIPAGSRNAIPLPDEERDVVRARAWRRDD